MLYTLFSIKIHYLVISINLCEFYSNPRLCTSVRVLTVEQSDKSEKITELWGKVFRNVILQLLENEM